MHSLCLATFGGDPDGGYRIGRCLQHHYEGKVALYVPQFMQKLGDAGLRLLQNALIIGNQGRTRAIRHTIKKN